MGVNPPDVHYITVGHHVIETYVQEIGRGGMVDSPMQHYFIQMLSNVKRFVDKKMTKYCQQDKCCHRDSSLILTSINIHQYRVF